MGPRALLGLIDPRLCGACGKWALETKMIEPGVKGACPFGVPPSSLGREGVTLTIPQNDTVGIISTEQNENVLRPPRERHRGGGGRNLKRGHGGISPYNLFF